MIRGTSIKVIIGFIIALIVMGTGAVITYNSLQDMMKIVNQAAEPDRSMIKLKEIVADISGAESGVRSFTLTPDDQYLQPFYLLKNTVDAKIDTLKLLTPRNGGDFAELNSIRDLLKQKLS